MERRAGTSEGDIPTRIARVELRCSDVEGSAEFYRRLVGLEVSELELERASLRPPDEGDPILVLHRAERAGLAPRRAAGLFHTAFRFRDRPALGAALRRLASEMAHPITGASDHGVSEAIYLDDPDGLGIELYRDRPRAEWPAPSEGEAVRMYTEPLDIGGVAAADDGAPAPEASAGVNVGHVHLKVADPESAMGFWEEVGMHLTTRFGTDAVFLGMDGYHHHVGANSWMSRGAEAEPAEGPGLEAVAVHAGHGGERLETPDGTTVLLEGDPS